MPHGLLLGVNRQPIYCYFKHAAGRGDEGDAFDFRFKLFQEVGNQTGCPLGVVSDLAVFEFYFQHLDLSSCKTKNPVGDATGPNRRVKSQLHSPGYGTVGSIPLPR